VFGTRRISDSDANAQCHSNRNSYRNIYSRANRNTEANPYTKSKTAPESSATSMNASTTRSAFAIDRVCEEDGSRRLFRSDRPG
jgi:hypothetical protein